MTTAKNTGAMDPAAEAAMVLARVVQEKADGLVALFYDTLLSDAEAATFLSNEVVQQRLVHSLRAWLLALLGPEGADDRAGFEAAQRKIGEVHARIKVPIALVMRSAQILKAELSQALMASPLSREGLAEGLKLLNTRMDIALMLMSEAYMSGTVRRAQIDEAFRLFAIGQDVTLEREAQRAALMEWSQNLLFGLFEKSMATSLQKISTSPFGLWVHHRAGLMFQGSSSLDSIDGAMRIIDEVLLPQIRSAQSVGTGLGVLVERLQATVAEIKFLLGDLFQSIAGVENGRDPLTRTLNRRFLPSILGREIAIAGSSGTPFTILMIDVDHFKQINDRWGHSAGDTVLRQVAEIILDSVRLNDFVFRYGGEEFLVALIETDAADGAVVADRIRTQLENRDLRLPNDTLIHVTASVGVAVYDGHPDHAYLVDAADRALYAAKAAGRNRTHIAGTG